MNASASRRLRVSIPVSFAALVLAVPVVGSTIWDGETNAGWGTAGNWSDNALPTFDNTTNLSFPTSAVTNFNTALGVHRVIRSMTFGASVDSAFGVNFAQFVSSGTAQNLTMGGGANSPYITVESGATGNITLGAPVASNSGAMILAGNLLVTHDGSGLLLFNRPIQISGSTVFGITKTGSGTMQVNNVNTFTGAININQGTLIANAASTTGGDLNAASAINLGGGTLEARAAFENKTYGTVPVNVTAASTLTWNNVNNFNYSLTFSGASAFDLGANLTVRNTSADTTFVNPINLSRAMTGSGNLLVETYNNIASTAANFSLGRVQLAGGNGAWTGDLVISRGTASLSGGDGVNSAGGGDIVIGTTADTFGAGLTFFPTGTAASTVTFSNPITVTSGGFRAIKAGGTNHSLVLDGDVALAGDLAVDHSLSTSGRTFTLAGDISGNGSLTVTNALGTTGTSLRLTGTNTYAGNTTVTSGVLIVDGSLTTPSISVASGARIGGNGSTSGNLSLSEGALLTFDPTATFDVAGNVTLANTFGIPSLVDPLGASIVWSNIPEGVYTLIGQTTSDFSNIANFGAANAFDLGGGRSAYFQNGSLQLVVIPEPAAYAALAGLGVLGLAAWRRRRA